MKYICVECGTLYDSLPLYKGEVECEMCGCSEVILTWECDGCHHYIFGKYIKTCLGDYYCEDCYREGEIE